MTPSDILQFIGVLAALVISLIGWSNKRGEVLKFEAETKKLKAETETLYQDIATKAEVNEKLQKEEIEKLNKTVSELERKIADLTETNQKKDDRIQELESLSIKQGNRIAELEKSNSNLEQEVQALRLKRK